MNEPTRHQYRKGQAVLVEGRVLSYEAGKPYGAVTVRFEAATDPSFLLDGVDIVAPQALVFFPSDIDVPDDYTSAEGFYPDD